ncbi:MAG TPA: hypothetical protein VGN86_03575, partial [Pyrinomonadaceae bacterium]|nr:hypothetical protein [Pyrinomonadaceae bacterium]
MRSFSVSITVSLLLVNSLLFSTVAVPQERREESRPRRAQPDSEPTKTDPVPERKPAQAWKAPTNSITAPEATTTRLEAEPTMRIALATDVRAASVSTSSQLLSA